ncbi:chromosome partitioning protein ParA [Solitalea sp. MAHUQ-68]|uniref:Chromosome partitioning protein ParA n=1 Tax=Solitalea agri TaxID=2953739 RepID=A0A9X2F3P9_9SPHI|nr:7TM diverse intracellular signaling domain-containing protein [Solitalea agri]MCO4291811.1 chromosome partitioning protein ParA [Solitalea agri]
MNRTLRAVFVVSLLLLTCFNRLTAQNIIAIDDKVNQHIFMYNDIQYLEDESGKLDINTVSSFPYSQKFQSSKLLFPHNFKRNVTYWYRIRLKNNQSSSKRWIFEFFDQTIDYIQFYMPLSNGAYAPTEFGDSFKFRNRQYIHKNYTMDITNNDNEVHTYYFKIKSAQKADALIVLRSVNWFVEYALNEYFFFGFFYGMIAVFCFYNLIMYFAIKEVQYLYYIAYLLAIALYEMCADGIAYEYLWPNYPNWNQHTTGFTLFAASFFALLFGRKLLNLKKVAPKLDKLIIVTLVCRSLFFLYCLIWFRSGFELRGIEVIPLSIAFYVGLRLRVSGYRPARFYVIAYSFLFLGLVVKSILTFWPNFLPYGPITHYSLSFCFVAEMMFLSVAIGDKVRLLREQKEVATQRTIKQLKLNHQLKDTLNKELEAQVKLKTQELVDANELLRQQADEIAHMNELLTSDNVQLKEDVAKVTEARIMSKDVDFDEFSKRYPDNESCIKFLAELKWHSGYNCLKCSHGTYYNGHGLLNKRCAKCGYEESVTANTILQNTRIPINKAFYMIFLLYSSNGTISSHKLSEILDIRQSTCWAYSSKIKKVLQNKRKGKKQAGSHGWSELLLEEIE